MPKAIILLIIAGILIIACKKTDLKSPPAPPANADINKPKLITDEISNLTFYSVRFSGSLTDSGRSMIKEKGFLVDTVALPTLKRNLNSFKTMESDDGHSFSTTVNEIPEGPTFYIRAYAINATDTGYGNQVQFVAKKQNIYSGDKTLATQEEVIEFGSHHYTTVDGNFTITGAASDLSPLMDLTIINYGFDIVNSALPDLKGLDNLEVIGAVYPHYFNVERNANLQNLKGLSKLKIIYGGFQIDNNASLVSFEGLDKFVLTSNGAIRIGENPVLQNVNGLKHLEFVGGDFSLINNPLLADIAELTSLHFVDGRFYVMNCPSLPSLNGLEGLNRLSDGVDLENNTLLADISGLRNLNSFGSDYGRGGITLDNNPLLTNIDVFEWITDIDYVKIQNNKGIQSLSGLKNLRFVGVLLNIENNASLLSLSGLESLTSASRIDILSNPLLTNLQGLNNLTTISGLLGMIVISRNPGLQTLSGLDNLRQVDNYVVIAENMALTDFCPLKKLLTGFTRSFECSGNAANPTQADIVTNCP